MAKDITLTVISMGGDKHEVQTPNDILCDDLISELCAAFQMAKKDAEGNPITYRLDNKDTGRSLPGRYKLSSAGVRDGQMLALMRVTVAGCFSESARVLLPSGTDAAIGTLRPGDPILAYDMGAGSYVRSEVEGIYQQTYSEQIILDDFITTTSDQHFLMTDGSWMIAEDLTSGDMLLRFPFGETEIREIKKQKDPRLMYSLTLKHSQCLVVEGLIVRDLLGKQEYLPRAVDVFLSYAATDKDEARIIFDGLDKQKNTVYMAD